MTTKSFLPAACVLLTAGLAAAASYAETSAERDDLTCTLRYRYATSPLDLVGGRWETVTLGPGREVVHERSHVRLLRNAGDLDMELLVRTGLETWGKLHVGEEETILADLLRVRCLETANGEHPPGGLGGDDVEDGQPAEPVRPEGRVIGRERERDGGGREGRDGRSRYSLRWETPITAQTLGYEPDPLVAGKSLSQIVNSEVVARLDGRTCRVCHDLRFGDRKYRPDVAGGAPIQPGTWIVRPGGGNNGYYRWNEPGSTGIVEAFMTTGQDGLGPKPQALKDALQKWVADGRQAGQ